MGKSTSLSERYKIKEMVSQGYSYKEISTSMNISMSTVKKWAKRTQLGQLESRLGRPVQGFLSTFSDLIGTEIVRFRREHEGWGPATIHAELLKAAESGSAPIPSVASIARYLKEQGLVKTYEPHSVLPGEKCKAPKDPHQLWEIDAEGNQFIDNVGYVAEINSKDVVSKSYVVAYPALMSGKNGHPNTDAYQNALRYGFSAHGLPEQIQVDHASVFYENSTKSPFPTRFHLWLVALGINLCYSRVNRPTDQAHVERSHQTISNQVIKGQFFKHWSHLFDKLQERRRFLNQDLPSASLKGKAPFEAFPTAKHSGRHYYPKGEAEQLCMKRVYDYLAKGKWFRRVASSQTVSLGGQVYYVSKAKPQEQLRIQFDSEKENLCFYNDKELLLAEKPLREMDIQFLTGTPDPSLNMINAQLKIPFIKNS